MKKPGDVVESRLVGLALFQHRITSQMTEEGAVVFTPTAFACVPETAYPSRFKADLSANRKNQKMMTKKKKPKGFKPKAFDRRRGSVNDVGKRRQFIVKRFHQFVFRNSEHTKDFLALIKRCWIFFNVLENIPHKCWVVKRSIPHWSASLFFQVVIPREKNKKKAAGHFFVLLLPNSFRSARTRMELNEHLVDI
jgi:hypothetical protein